MTNKNKATSIAVQHVKSHSFKELQVGTISQSSSFVLKAFVNDVYKDVLSCIKYLPTANSKMINSSSPMLKIAYKSSMEIALPSLLLPVPFNNHITRENLAKSFCCAIDEYAINFNNGNMLHYVAPVKDVNCISYNEPSIIAIIAKILQLVDTDITPKSQDDVIAITSDIVYFFIFRAIMHEVSHIFIAYNVDFDVHYLICNTGLTSNSSSKLKDYKYNMFSVKDNIVGITQETDADMMSAMCAINMFNDNLISKEQLLIMLISGYKQSTCYILKDVLYNLTKVPTINDDALDANYQLLFILSVFLYIKQYKHVPDSKARFNINVLNVSKLHITYSLFDYCTK